MCACCQAGLVRLTVEEAELNAAKKGKEYFAVVSVGNQARAARCAWLPSSLLAD